MNDPARRRPSILWLVAGLLLLLKLVVVARCDMPCLGGGHDDYWCVQRSLDWYWGAKHYDQMLLIKEPGWPIVLACLERTGIPLRAMLELLLWGTALAAAFLVRDSFQRLRAPAFWWTFCLVFLSPLALRVFERTTYDAFFAMVFALSLAVLFPIARARDLRSCLLWLALYGSLLGILTVTRGEGMVILLAGIGGVIPLCLGWAGPWRTRLRLTLGAMALVLACICAIQAPVRTANWLRFGAPFISEQTEGNYERATARLAQIDTGAPVPGTPIPMAAFEAAAAHSPAVAEILPKLKGDIGTFWSRVWLVRRLHPEGEIGGGWVLWAIRDAVAATGHYGSPAQARAFYAGMAGEIEAAFSDGRLKRRAILHPMIGPLPAVGDLGRSAIEIVAGALQPKPWQPISEAWIPQTQSAFDRACDRKATFLEKEWDQVVVDGVVWDRALPGPLTSVMFEGRSGAAVPGTVKGVFSDKYTVRGEIGFELAMPNVPGNIVLKDYHGHLTRIPTPVSDSGGEMRVEDGWSVELAVSPRITERHKRHLQLASVISGWAWLAALGVGAAVAAGMAVRRAIRRWQAPADGGTSGMHWLNLLAIALGGILLVRIGMMSVVDASAFFMRDGRYVFPLALAFPLLVLALAAGGDARRRSAEAAHG